MFIIPVYIDDILLAGKSDKQMREVKEALAKQFEVKDMGELHYFLGVNIVQNQKEGNIWIGQPAFTEGIMQKFGMENAKAVNAPFGVGKKTCESPRGL